MQDTFRLSRRRLLFAAVLAAAGGACGRRATFAPVPSGASVLAFGDSVTFGTGAGPGEDWAALLASRTAWRITNAGVPGDTAEAAAGRLAPLLVEHRPALVIVELGGNDFLKRRPPAAVKEALRRMLREIRASGAQAVLVSVPEMSLLGVVARRPTDAPLYAELGKEEGVAVIADVFSGVLGRPELCADPIHPNAEGYRVMAAGIHAALRTAGIAPA